MASIRRTQDMGIEGNQLDTGASSVASPAVIKSMALVAAETCARLRHRFSRSYLETQGNEAKISFNRI